MHTHSWKLAGLAVALALPLGAHAQTKIVELNAHDHGASATLAEHQPDNVQDSRNLVSVRRFNQNGTVIRNNIGAFRFDLPQVVKPGSTILNAELSFALQAATGGITAEFAIYGLNANAAKGDITAQNWYANYAAAEGVTFNTMPGLLEADSDMSNPAIDPATTVFLGNLTVPASSAAGTALLFSSEALLDYINTNLTGSVTFLLEMRGVGTGRDENVSLLSGNRESAGSSFYPTLTLEEQQVPEAGHAAAIILLAAAGVIFAKKRAHGRRRSA